MSWKKFVPLCLGALPVLIPSAPAWAQEYLNIKGYAEVPFSLANTFNYTGSPVTVTNIATGITQVRFAGLNEWAYFPTVHVSPKTTNSDGYDVCAASFGTQGGPDLVVTVTCKRSGSVTDTGFSLMIVDQTSSAGYTQISQSANCVGCGTKAFSHNPWRRVADGQPPIQLFRMATGRSKVVFRTDWPVAKNPYPIALVTPVSENASCQLYSVGFGGETPNQLGAEVMCTNFAGMPMDASFRLMLVPQSNRTGYALILQNGTPWQGYLSNPRGLPEEFGDGYINIQKTGIGKYEVGFPRLADHWVDAGAIKVNSHGGSGINCGVVSFVETGGYPRASIACKRPDSSLVDSNFIILMTSRN